MSSNYPAGAEFDPTAPYNQEDPPYRSFDVTVNCTLKRNTVIDTNNYDIESDDDIPNTINTNWEAIYRDSDYTPIDLLNMLKEYVSHDITTATGNRKNMLENILKEINEWTEDEFYIEPQ